MKATEQYFTAMLFIMLYKVVATVESMFATWNKLKVFTSQEAQSCWTNLSAMFQKEWYSS